MRFITRAILFWLFWLTTTSLAWAQEAVSSATCSGSALQAYCALTIQGATQSQEALVRDELRIVQPEVLPSRIIFVPHWKYIYTAKVYQLHVPKGMSSVMFTHLPSRSVFIDQDHIVSDEALVHWMAHELGHLTTNSSREDDAERAAKPFRARFKVAAAETMAAGRTAPQAEIVSGAGAEFSSSTVR
jgi:hypothetical protein